MSEDHNARVLHAFRVFMAVAPMVAGVTFWLMATMIGSAFYGPVGTIVGITLGAPGPLLGARGSMRLAHRWDIE